jgi:hypothetical protein
LAISEHFTVNLHKSLIGALSFNFARHRQLRQHAVSRKIYIGSFGVNSRLPLPFHRLTFL